MMPDTERGTAPGSEPLAEAADELVTPRAEASEYMDDTDMRFASFSDMDDRAIRAGSGSGWWWWWADVVAS
jgi:hypothetical protein